MKHLFIIFVSLVQIAAWAEPNVGRIVTKAGTVSILREPQDKSTNRQGEVLLESRYYINTPAKIGMRIQRGEVVQSGADGQAKIIFDNGDQLIVGPGTSYFMTWGEDDKNAPGAKGKAEGNNVMNLFYGKVRAVVSPQGPRQQMKVKTQAATAGVRGTDFFVSYAGQVGTQLSVLRGKVAVEAVPTAPVAPTTPGAAPAPAPVAKPVVIEQGFSAQVDDKPKVDPAKPQDAAKVEKPAEIKVVETTKRDLAEIKSITPPKPTEEELKTVSAQDKKEIAKLEEKAVATVVADIKKSNPQLLAKMKDDTKGNADSINDAVLANLYKAAPKGEAVKNKKPTKEELSESMDDAYSKYFSK